MRLKEQQLIDSYIDWLKEKITSREIGNAIEITSPLMDRHNDFLQIYVVPDGDQLRVTDDGYILNDLLLSGCDVDVSNKRKEVLNSLLRGYGVSRSVNNELYINATIENFPQRKHMLVQAMLTVNDMFLTTRETVESIFWEDVEMFLLSNDIRFTDRVNFTGKSGFIQSFDFLIPRSKKRGDRLIRALSNPTKTSAQNVLFAWEDIKNNRREDTTLFTIINDNQKKISNEVISALHQYDVKTILWSQRNSFIAELSA